MSRIDKIDLNARNLGSQLRKTARRGAAPSDGLQQKNFGEKPPSPADISKDPELMKLFSQRGLVGWLEDKIKRASRHKGYIIPAEDITAMAMPHIPGKQDGNKVFLGTEFVRKNQSNPDLIAGVLAHEWGHLISDFLIGRNAEDMDWGRINELRREEESYADAYAGRLLYLIGHKPDDLIKHLAAHECCSPKYFNFETRKAIILTAFNEQIRRQETAARIFAPNGGSHPLGSRLIAEV